jgi:hypothetical protein
MYGWLQAVQTAPQAGTALPLALLLFWGGLALIVVGFVGLLRTSGEGHLAGLILVIGIVLALVGLGMGGS